MTNIKAIKLKIFPQSHEHSLYSRKPLVKSSCGDKPLERTLELPLKSNKQGNRSHKVATKTTV